MLGIPYFWPEWNYFVCKTGFVPHYFQNKEVTLSFPRKISSLKFSVIRLLTHVAYCTPTRSEMKICTEHERDSYVMVRKVTETTCSRVLWPKQCFLPTYIVNSYELYSKHHSCHPGQNSTTVGAPGICSRGRQW